MMNKFVGIAYPCIWAVPEAMTGVVPSLVHCITQNSLCEHLDHITICFGA
jgi:hypothetical protein